MNYKIFRILISNEDYFSNCPRYHHFGPKFANRNFLIKFCTFKFLTISVYLCRFDFKNFMALDVVEFKMNGHLEMDIIRNLKFWTKTLKNRTGYDKVDISRAGSFKFRQSSHKVISTLIYSLLLYRQKYLGEGETFQLSFLHGGMPEVIVIFEFMIRNNGRLTVVLSFWWVKRRLVLPST